MTDQQQNATIDRARPVWEKAFLSSLRKVGNVSIACRAARIERSTAYRHYKADSDFKALWDDALDEAADLLEFEALRRAKHGTKKAIYYKGHFIAYEIEYSDTLMALLLKAHKPEKYRERVDQHLHGSLTWEEVIKQATDGDGSPTDPDA